MATEFTFTAGEGTITASDTAWSVDSLSSHLVGEMDAEHNADGTAPGRFMRTVRDAGVDLWTSTDWRFRNKLGELTTVAETAYAVLPTDFSELRASLLKETSDQSNDTTEGLRIARDLADFTRRKDSFADDAEGPPAVGFILNVDTDDFTPRMELVPIPDKIYTYRFPYIMLDPWGAGVTADDGFPIWPKTFHHGWELNASWRLKKFFHHEDWKDARALYYDWLKNQLAENDEYISHNVGRFESGYDDLGREAAATPSDVELLRLS